MTNVIPFRRRREVVIQECDEGFGAYWSVHVEHPDGSRDLSVHGQIFDVGREAEVAWFADATAKAFGLSIRGWA